MFIAGYVYNSNPQSPGFRPEPTTFRTAGQAKKWIEGKVQTPLDVTYEFSGNKYRAVVNGRPTGYIYFQVETSDLWILYDISLQKNYGMGPLGVMKKKAEKLLTRELALAGVSDQEIKTLSFTRNKDSISTATKSSGGLLNWDIILIKVK
jgi:hypothetical protein